MRTVHKVLIDVNSSQEINIHGLQGARSFKDQFLAIAVQGGLLCIWCLVDTEEPTRDVSFRVVRVDEPLNPFITKDSYLGTVQFSTGYFKGNKSLAFHVFMEE